LISGKKDTGKKVKEEKRGDRRGGGE